MSYDKYRDWPLPGLSRTQLLVGLKKRELEEQVLEDLAAAKDEDEKLEILDSYAAYWQRAYAKDFADEASSQAGIALGQLLSPVFELRMPTVICKHRGVIGKPRSEPKQDSGP
jgi:hypothetical protein